MSLRLRLREETRESHDEVDACFNAFNTIGQEGYTRFLLAHDAALRLVSTRVDIQHCQDVLRNITTMIAGIQRDLQQMGWPENAVPTFKADGRSLHSDAVRYVIWGSQIGMTVLYRRWCKAGIAPVQATNEFLCAPFDKAQWKLLCERLSQTPASGADADSVVADAQAIFGIYTASTHLVQTDLSHA